MNLNVQFLPFCERNPNTYAAAFADIAAQRKDLEDRRGALARLLTISKKNGSQNAQPPASCLAQQPLEGLARVLSSDIVPGQEKRDLVDTVIDRVVCQPKGADVFFLPGLGAARFYTSPEGVETCNSTLLRVKTAGTAQATPTPEGSQPPDPQLRSLQLALHAFRACSNLRKLSVNNS